MARSFNYQGDFLGSTSAPRPWWTATGTIFALMNTYWTSGNSTGHMVIFMTSTDLTNNFTFVKHTDNNLYVGWTTGGVDARIVLPDTGLFTPLGPLRTHIVDWDDTANLQHLYYDNSLIGTSTIAFTVPAGNADSYVLGSTGSATPWNGAMAELARWDRVLTADERAVLEATRCPLFVPRGLVSYLPLIGRTSPEVELIRGENLTVSGEPLAASHPRVRYPSAPYVPSLEAAAVSIPSIGPPLISNAFTVFAPSVLTSGAISPPVIANPFTLYAPTVSTDLGLLPPLLSNAFAIYAPSINVTETPIQEDSRTLEPYNLDVELRNYVAGDNLRISRLYTGLAGGIDVLKAYLTIKHREKDVDANAILQKQINSELQASGRILDDDTTGGSIELYFDLSKDETALLTPVIPYHYDVQIITTASGVYTCEKGVMVMHQGITDASS